MDLLKLKLERLGCNAVLEQQRLPNIERFYFEQSKPQSVPVMICLMKWLFLMNKIQPKWTAETDQSKIIDEIASILKSQKLSVPQAVLKNGFGPELIEALHGLCDKVLPVNGVPDIKSDVVTGVANQRQILYEHISEAIATRQDTASAGHKLHFAEFDGYVPLEHSVWQKEVDSLQLDDLRSNAEWRLRWTQLNNHLTNISTLLTALKDPTAHLVATNTDIMEKIHAREKHLNETFSDLISAYRHVYEQYTSGTHTKQSEQEAIKTMTADLIEASSTLDTVIRQMDECGSKITDATPLTEIKTAMLELRRESLQSDIVISVYRQGHLRRTMDPIN